MSKKDIKTNMYGSVLLTLIVTILLATQGSFDGALAFYVIGFFTLLTLISN